MMYICEKCGKEVTNKYGSGRFCSKSCANSRTHSKETREKIKNSLKNNFEHIEFNGKMITKNSYLKKLKQNQISYNKKHLLAEQIHLSSSPYSDFDVAYQNSGSAKDCYYFTKHDSDNKIIDRCIVPIYRYVIECKLGRKLGYNEVVHHVDGNHFNNSIDNLMVLDRSTHVKLHHGTITLEEIYENKLNIEQ